jgi:hypothetical protein
MDPPSHNYYRYGYIVTEVVALLSIACSAAANFLDHSSFGDRETAGRVKLAAGIMAIVGVALTKLSTELYRVRSRRRHHFRLREASRRLMEMYKGHRVAEDNVE